MIPTYHDTGCPLPHQHPRPLENSDTYICHYHQSTYTDLLRYLIGTWPALVGLVLEPPARTGHRLRGKKQTNRSCPANLHALALTDPRDQSSPAGRIRAIQRATTLDPNEYSTPVLLELLHDHRWATWRHPWAALAWEQASQAATGVRTALDPQPQAVIARCPAQHEVGECGGALVALDFTLGVRCRRCHSHWVGPDELHRLARLTETVLDDGLQNVIQ